MNDLAEKRVLLNVPPADIKDLDKPISYEDFLALIPDATRPVDEKSMEAFAKADEMIKGAQEEFKKNEQ